MCSDSTASFPSASPSLAGWPGGGHGKRYRCCFSYHPPWQLLRWRLGWKDCCCHWLSRNLLAISTFSTLCSVAVSVAAWPTVYDLSKNTGTERSGPVLAAYHRAGWATGSSIGEAPAAVVERLSCWTASRYICAFTRVCIHMLVPECALTRRFLLHLRLWSAGRPLGGVAGKGGPALPPLLLLSSSLAAAQVEA